MPRSPLLRRPLDTQPREEIPTTGRDSGRQLGLTPSARLSSVVARNRSSFKVSARNPYFAPMMLASARRRKEQLQEQLRIARRSMIPPPPPVGGFSPSTVTPAALELACFDEARANLAELQYTAGETRKATADVLRESIALNLPPGAYASPLLPPLKPAGSEEATSQGGTEAASKSKGGKKKRAVAFAPGVEPQRPNAATPPPLPSMLNEAWNIDAAVLDYTPQTVLDYVKAVTPGDDTYDSCLTAAAAFHQDVALRRRVMARRVVQRQAALLHGASEASQVRLPRI